MVTIHHTGGPLVSQTPFVAFGACDVKDGEIVRHFDIGGNELMLAGELAAPPHPAVGTGG